MNNTKDKVLKYAGAVRQQINNQGLDLLLYGSLKKFKLNKLLANPFGEIPLSAFMQKVLSQIPLLQHGLKGSKFFNMSSLAPESLKRISLLGIQDVVKTLSTKALSPQALKTLKWSHLTATAQKALTPANANTATQRKLTQQSTTTASAADTVLTDAMVSKLVIGDINLQLLGLTAADVDPASLATIGFSTLSDNALAKINLGDFLPAELDKVQVKAIPQALRTHLSNFSLDSVKSDFLGKIKISSLTNSTLGTLKLTSFTPWKLEQLGLEFKLTDISFVKKSLNMATDLVTKVKSFHNGTAMNTVRKYIGYAGDFVKRMDSVINQTKGVNNAVSTWTGAEAGLQEVLVVIKKVIEETGLQDIVGDVAKSQKGLVQFGKNVVNIASKVVGKVSSYVPVADEFLGYAETILNFIENFDSIADIIRNLDLSIKLTKENSSVAVRDPTGCHRVNSTLPDLCVSQTTITPQVSLYKKVFFPLEMMFLNMLSTKGMIPDISTVGKFIYESDQRCNG